MLITIAVMVWLFLPVFASTALTPKSCTYLPPPNNITYSTPTPPCVNNFAPPPPNPILPYFPCTSGILLFHLYLLLQRVLKDRWFCCHAWLYRSSSFLYSRSHIHEILVGKLHSFMNCPWCSKLVLRIMVLNYGFRAFGIRSCGHICPSFLFGNFCNHNFFSAVKGLVLEFIS